MTVKELSYIANQDRKDDEARGFAWRVFSGKVELSGTAENNWGLPIEIPDWITQCHNVALGKRVFICGTGPSIVSQLETLKTMKNEDIWTVNRMVRWREFPFHPMCHAIAEPGPLLSWGDIMRNEYEFPGALNKVAVSWWSVSAPGWLWCPKAPDDIQIRWQGMQGLDEKLAPLPTGWASPLTISQLAAWMGYKEIYFLGCDTTQTGQAWDATYGRTAKERNIRSILECFERAGRDMKRAGRLMADCSTGGRINKEGCLEYIPLEVVLDYKG